MSFRSIFDVASFIVFCSIACLLITLALAIFAPSYVFGQSFPIETPTSEAMAFETEFGVVTADHINDYPATVRFPAWDVRVYQFRTRRKFFKLGSGLPKYFRDRRGNLVSFEIVERRDKIWIVSSRFYAGESGLPVFDASGDFVGVVLGNVRDSDGSWLGRVARFSRLRKSAVNHLPVLVPSALEPAP